MAAVVITGDTSGSVTLQAPAVAGTTTLTLPSTSGTVLTTASTTGISGSAISSGTVAEAYGGTGTTTGYYGFKNRIINGAMTINQRATSVTDTGYVTDRWQYAASVASKATVSQDTSVYPAGFNASLKVLSSSSYSVGSGELFAIKQAIEGFNFADMTWGTANAKTITISFWVYSSLTGTFGGALQNGAQNRSYPFTYTINAANTWEQKSVTIAGDTSGTWVGATNGVGVYVFFGLGCGSTVSGTAGSWAGAAYWSATGATSVVGTNGATFYITGVQLEKGSTATSFDYRPYGTELALCQRYCHAYSSYSLGRARDGDTVYGGGVTLSPTMRATPTLRSGATFTANTGSAGTPQILSTAGSASSPDNVYVNSSTSSWTTNALIALTNAVFEAEL